MCSLESIRICRRRFLETESRFDGLFRVRGLVVWLSLRICIGRCFLGLLDLVCSSLLGLGKIGRLVLGSNVVVGGNLAY